MPYSSSTILKKKNNIPYKNKQNMKITKWSTVLVGKGFKNVTKNF